ncbi:MAG TPA: hypothetical protein PLU39_13550 [Armatimonadota bacterium]|jgi:hypothetical protein|nr:hypothetical protein [Armatimonadota bacterium]HOJ20791.1 hypothetical protein [Armatimonadota bacterium]HOM81895.1 hypothetical protein [Armatimonadota bacterium]HPO71895.1 hypothetical protein [Armatimonadota bacterium]HPT98887.1 hypothetical protein [Armatimonadota bacterium]
MRVTMARGTRAFRLPAEPKSRFLEDEEGELWVVQQVTRVNGEYEVLCRHATRIEQRLYEREQQAASGA